MLLNDQTRRTRKLVELEDLKNLLVLSNVKYREVGHYEELMDFMKPGKLEILCYSRK